jgi:glycosyltransferase involved in cell wall biosynthesis
VPLVLVVIPCRRGSHAELTLASLAKQTFREFDVVLQYDYEKGAAYARNKGFREHERRSDYVLFADDDVYFEPFALELLLDTLCKAPGDVAYSYGAYKMGRLLFCDQEFDPKILLKRNFISTMSLIRVSRFIESGGFDESLLRLQDYELWLRMWLQFKWRGAYCKRVIFSTELRRNGITYGNTQQYSEAIAIVRRKHGLELTE